MSNTGVLYMRGMNTSDSDDDFDDVWDDRILNESYDKALKMANLEVAKRLALATNSSEAQKGKTSGETSESQPDQPQNTNQKKSKQKKPQRQAQVMEESRRWKEGMKCRAKYDVDGLDYEAIVLTILGDDNCVIKYLGYNNTEIVPISYLQPSLGKQARKEQIVEAMANKDEDQMSTGSSFVDNGFVDGTPPTRGAAGISGQRVERKKRNKLSDKNFALPNIPMPDLSTLRDFGEIDMPLAPPPLVTTLGAQSCNDDQALSNMLVSWYMSGYYTGLYQGSNRSRARQRDF